MGFLEGLEWLSGFGGGAFISAKYNWNYLRCTYAQEIFCLYISFQEMTEPRVFRTILVLPVVAGLHVFLKGKGPTLFNLDLGFGFHYFFLLNNI